MRLYKSILIAVITLTACSGNHKKADAYGNFETTEILVSSEIQGKLIKFSVEEGDSLQKGEQVGAIDTVQLSLKRDQLVAQRKASAAKIENILSQIQVQEEQKKTYLVDKDRIEKLLKDKAVPEKQLDDINGHISVTESQINSIRTQNASVLSELTSFDKQIEQLNDQILRCKIVNPINGVVLDKYIEPSEIAVAGKALYKIADVNRMILKVYISGAQLPAVKIRQKVSVFIDQDKKDDQELEGEITWVSSQAEFTPKIIQTKEERVNLVYAVKVAVKNDGRIKIGMPGEVRFNSPGN
jgi:HlyD family secretion protein